MSPFGMRYFLGRVPLLDWMQCAPRERQKRELSRVVVTSSGDGKGSVRRGACRRRFGGCNRRYVSLSSERHFTAGGRDGRERTLRRPGTRSFRQRNISLEAFKRPLTIHARRSSSRRVTKFSYGFCTAGRGKQARKLGGAQHPCKHTDATPSQENELCHCGNRLWHAVDRLENAGSNLVRVALRIRTAIFQVALVAVLDEIHGHADGSATIG